ncbi:MAG: DUF6517 family protein [Halobacteriota archaeon]
MVDRMGPLRTVMGRFVERINDGRISDGAVVISAADLGVKEVPFGLFEGAPTAPGDLVSVVVPAGTRSIKIESPSIEQTMILAPGEAFGEKPLEPAQGAAVGVDRVVGLNDLLPDQSWAPNAVKIGHLPGSGWLTERARHEKIEISVEKVERAKVAPVSTGSDAWGDAFGDVDADLPGRRLEPGEAFGPAETLVAMTGTALLEGWPDDGPPKSWPKTLDFDDAVPAPAPMGGVTFGVGILSTPSASVGGESLNPLSRLATLDLLQQDEARKLLARAGITDVDEAEWTEGPDPISPADGPSTVTLLGTETEIESFVGVVTGDAGPWGVGVHVVRIDEDDHVIVAGVHRRVVGSAEDTMAALRQGDDVVEARKLLVETVGQLE